MKLKDAEKWNAIAKAQITDGSGYSNAIVRYAAKWAELMEARIAKGATVMEMADETSHEADPGGTYGITGFQFGAARAILIDCWAYGDELLAWREAEKAAFEAWYEAERAKQPGEPE